MTHNPGRVVAGLLFTLIGVAFLLQSLDVWTVKLVWFWPLLLIGVGVGVLLGRARRQQVEESRSAQLAVAEERVRIARELHDIVAHSVSLMTVQIAAARRVFQKQPDEADRALAAAEQTGRESLAELRSMLSMLRGADASIEAASFRLAHEGEEPDDGRAPMPRLGDIEGLVDSVRDAGLDVAFQVEGEPPAVSGGVELAVYRVVQEALTNVVRHAGRASVDVCITYDPAFIDVRIEDDGNGNAPGTRPSSGGHGLVGMKERVAAAGGVVYAGPAVPGPGWQVHARMPIVGSHR